MGIFLFQEPEETIPKTKNRRVNFILNKNTSQSNSYHDLPCFTYWQTIFIQF